jgi:hypothetical protein
MVMPVGPSGWWFVLGAAKRPGPVPSATQYAMLGETGGMGSFTRGHMWAPTDPSKANPLNKGCFSYGRSFVHTSADEARAYGWILGNISVHPEVSAAIYTQTTDVENECDGFLNYDRTKKMGAADEAAILARNLQLIGRPTVAGQDAKHGPR